MRVMILLKKPRSNADYKLYYSHNLYVYYLYNLSFVFVSHQVYDNSLPPHTTSTTSHLHLASPPPHITSTSHHLAPHPPHTTHLHLTPPRTTSTSSYLRLNTVPPHSASTSIRYHLIPPHPTSHLNTVPPQHGMILLTKYYYSDCKNLVISLENNALLTGL